MDTEIKTWFNRGGDGWRNTSAGAFYASYYDGTSDYSYSFRSVLVEALRNAAVLE